MRKIITFLIIGAVIICYITQCSDRTDSSDITGQTNNLSPNSENQALKVIYAYPGGEGTSGSCETEWGTPVIVAFSESVDPSTVSASTFKVGNNKEGRVEVCGNTVVFKPTLAFDNLILVQVTVSKEITDHDGNGMTDDYTFSFCTRGDP
jgi:hypothetical protein